MVWIMRCTMKIKMTFVATLLLIALNLMTGGAEKFVKTRKNPDAQPVNWKGKKVAAFVMTVRKDTRQGTEHALARELIQRGAQGVPGYMVVPPERGGERDSHQCPFAFFRFSETPAGVEGTLVTVPVFAISRSFRSDPPLEPSTGPNNLWC